MTFLTNRFSKLLVLAVLSLTSGLFFAYLAFGLIALCFDIPMGEIATAMEQLDHPQSILITKVVLFFNSLGLFVVAPLLFVLLYKKNVKNYFGLNHRAILQLIPLVIFLFFLLLPVINLGVAVNQQLELPPFMAEVEQWMRMAEDSAAVKTKALLEMNGYGDLIINLLLIGLLPAVGEELCFRGVVQQVLLKTANNHHFGIWLAAAIFSFVHFQFFGFLPRMLLGAFFGYLFFWTKSLWFPIFAHFLNNSFAVLAAYYWRDNGWEDKLEKVGATEDSLLFSIVAMVLFLAGMLWFKKQTQSIV